VPSEFSHGDKSSGSASCAGAADKITNLLELGNEVPSFVHLIYIVRRVFQASSRRHSTLFLCATIIRVLHSTIISPSLGSLSLVYRGYNSRDTPYMLARERASASCTRRRKEREARRRPRTGENEGGAERNRERERERERWKKRERETRCDTHGV